MSLHTASLCAAPITSATSEQCTSASAAHLSAHCLFPRAHPQCAAGRACPWDGLPPPGVGACKKIADLGFFGSKKERDDASVKPALLFGPSLSPCSWLGSCVHCDSAGTEVLQVQSVPLSLLLCCIPGGLQPHRLLLPCHLLRRHLSYGSAAVSSFAVVIAFVDPRSV